MDETNIPSQDQLDKMTIEELEAIARRDYEISDVDQDYLMEAMDVLARRYREKGVITKDTHTAWEEFQESYMSCKPEPLEKIMKSNTAFTTIKPTGKKVFRAVSKIAVAAVLAVVLFSVIPTSIGAESLFTVVARWTESLLIIKQPGGETIPEETIPPEEYTTGIGQLRYAVKMITNEKIVPEWLPDEFTFDSLQISASKGYTIIGARFVSGEKEIILHYMCNLSSTDINFEKDENMLDTETLNGIKHYFFENTDSSTCAWALHNVSCSISGNVTIAEMHKIIESIYEEVSP